MIDLHGHLLPQVDDGPSDWEEVQKMLQTGAKDGIQEAVCTSHVLNELSEEVEAKFQFKFQQLQKLVQEWKIPIRLWLGAELHINAKFDPLSPLATIAGNRKYILLELPLTEMPHGTSERLFELFLAKIQPILAHPERNLVLSQKPQMAYEFVQRGVLFQINAGSLTGAFGRYVRKVAFSFLEHRLVHFVASDCHGFRTRSMILSKAYHIVNRKHGQAMADLLFKENPRKAIYGEEISMEEPVPFVKVKKPLFSFLRESP